MRRENGTGTINKLSGKRRKPWAAIAPGVLDPTTGEHIRELIGTFKTRMEAENALNKYILNPYTLSEITLDEMYKNWSERHYETVSASTARTYTFGYKNWASIGNMKVRDITPQILQAVLDKQKGKSKSTINQTRLIMSQLCKEAMRLQIHTSDYSELLISPKAKEQKEKEIFEKAEIGLMWDNLNKIEFMEIPLILIYTGMRIGELASCKLESVNLEDRYILHGSKTEAGRNRIIPIPKKIYPIIERLVENNFKYLIEKDGRKVNIDYLRKSMYYKAIEQIDVKQLNPHACRRTYATMLNANVNNKQFITRILGHADFETTDRFYVINQSRELVKAVDFLQ